MTIGSTPHGGYALSIPLDACMRQQAATAHRDPAHIRCDFFTPASAGAVQIEIKVLSTSKRWTRLDFDLLQYPTPGDRSSGDRKLILRGHAMFTDLPALTPPAPPTGQHITVLPHTPAKQARICPLRRHPAELKGVPLDYAFNFKDVRWAQDVDVEGRADEDGRQKMEWGAWWQMTQDEDRIDSTAALMPFLADQFKNGPELLRDEHKIEGRFWFPTLTFALEFKAKFPLSAIPNLDGTRPASHTVGLYSHTKFCEEGRHDITVEVWSAPSELGAQGITVGSDEWRQHAQILGISTQMALVVPFSVNQRNAKPATASGKL